MLYCGIVHMKRNPFCFISPYFPSVSDKAEFSDFYVMHFMFKVSYLFFGCILILFWNLFFFFCHISKK